MLLSFDVVPEAVAEHDEWHTHEHLPERLSIPGFLRGTRWVAVSGGPRYFVIYEVDDLATLSSAPYLARLNNPSLWTSRMMRNYRAMSRGFCSVTGSFGLGLGSIGLFVHFNPAVGSESSLRKWLLQHALPELPSKPGIGSAHLFEAAATPPMTNEQRIRGADAGVGWVVLASGYSESAVADVKQAVLSAAQLELHGATGIRDALYRTEYSLDAREIG
jgi:hypothetical protein